MSSKYKNIRPMEPINPYRSTKDAKIKSLVAIGKNFKLVCVAFSFSFPAIPPEPIAIKDCLT